jgi:hypothetical protein
MCAASWFLLAFALHFGQERLVFDAVRMRRNKLHKNVDHSIRETKSRFCFRFCSPRLQTLRLKIGRAYDVSIVPGPGFSKSSIGLVWAYPRPMFMHKAVRHLPLRNAPVSSPSCWRRSGWNGYVSPLGRQR